LDALVGLISLRKFEYRRPWILEQCPLTDVEQWDQDKWTVRRDTPVPTWLYRNEQLKNPATGEYTLHIVTSSGQWMFRDVICVTLPAWFEHFSSTHTLSHLYRRWLRFPIVFHARARHSNRGSRRRLMP
jgi:hypothetical protein